MKTFRFLVTLIFFSPWFISMAAGDEVALVETFCSRAVQGELPQWDSLVVLLESGALVEVAPPQIPSFETCLKEHRAFFSSGEFILKGKQHLVRAAAGIEAVGPTAGAVGMESSEFELPLVGQVSLTVRPREAAAAVDPHGFQERSRRYDELWKQFLGQLQSRLTSVANAQQVASIVK